MPTILTATQARAYMKRRQIQYSNPIPTMDNNAWGITVWGKPDRPFNIPEFHLTAPTEEEALVEAARKCVGYKFSRASK